MFRNGLLISTAMTAVALLLGAPAGAFARSDMHAAPPDANTRFLRTYGCANGQFPVTFYSEKSDGWHFYSAAVAVPITGHGQTVNQIVVRETQYSHTSGTKFSAGIYTNNRKGFPGKLIAGGTGNAGSRCGYVTIPIASTTLKANTKYWVEEKGLSSENGSSTFDFIGWAVNPKEKRKAYVQTYTQSCSSTSSCHSSRSPWTKQTTGPWFRLR